MVAKSKHDTVEKVLMALELDQLQKLNAHAEKSKFHHGGRWFGPEPEFAGQDARFTLASDCMMAVAFDLSRDDSRASWWGAKVDTNSLNAYQHILDHAGGDVGADRFVEEMRDLSHDDLKTLIAQVAVMKSVTAKQEA